ncbi:juvenile hormone acid O-methyltransferase-like [Diabrotica virgifera virgifera]|uniref:Juvenile hormone acid O-methyltransferase-like n=1 Tax=Diabrotica virgifera virgifera TaxID=50390 RepID=A0A6P7F4K9_DIAVI|nr:juvenile hormone acid O-methyltransferase-like [Diabrotica virgifera virgifera]
MITDLWVRGNIITQIAAQHTLDKYKHLLKWKNNETILEFGAADGKTSVNAVLPALPKDYKEYVLTDVSHGMVEYMKKNLNIPRSKIMQHDIATVKLQDEFKNKFDHIFGIWVMHMVPNPRQGFININKMLKPGGQAFVSFGEVTPTDPAFHNLLKNPKWSRYGHMLSPHYYSDNIEESYKKDINAAGFKSYQFHVEKDYQAFFESRERLMTHFTAINNVLPRIPEDLKDEYLRDYYKEIESSGQILYIERDGQQIPYVNAKLFIVVMNKHE